MTEYVVYETFPDSPPERIAQATWDANSGFSAEGDPDVVESIESANGPNGWDTAGAPNRDNYEAPVAESPTEYTEEQAVSFVKSVLNPRGYVFTERSMAPAEVTVEQ